MDREIARKAYKLAYAAMLAYGDNNERSAIRCALGDAAALCDAISAKIGNDNRVRGNRISKRGLELAAIASRCANELWAMRSCVHNKPTNIPHEQSAKEQEGRD